MAAKVANKIQKEPYHQMTVLLTVMKAEVKRQKEALGRVQKLKGDVVSLQEQVNHASANLPQRLPNKAMPPPSYIPPTSNSTSPTPVHRRFAIPETPQSNYPSSNHTTPLPSVEQIKKKAPTLFLPTIEYITTDEFESIPKYMKGRITYSQVNAAVENFNKTLELVWRFIYPGKS